MLQRRSIKAPRGTSPHGLAPAPAPTPTPTPKPPPAPKPAHATRVKRSIRSLLTPEQLNCAIQRESARVDRKAGTSLVLVLFRFTAPIGAPSTMRLAKTILHRIRVTDDVGWFDEQHVGVLLPDTSPAGAWRLAQHICDRMARRGQRPHIVMYSYGGEDGGAIVAGAAPRIVRQTDEPAVPDLRV